MESKKKVPARLLKRSQQPAIDEEAEDFISPETKGKKNEEKKDGKEELIQSEVA